jgi:hypothetical protein
MTDTKTISLGRTVRVPTTILFAKSIAQKQERALFFVKLMAECPNIGGTYDVKGIPVRFRAGQTIQTHDSLGKLWGVTRDVARRVIEGFERDGLISAVPTAQAPEIVLEDGSETPPGTLITVLHMKDDPKTPATAA